MPLALPLPRPLFQLLQDDFDALPDPRINRTRLHRLSDILLLSLAAFCCGADSFEDIQAWCVAHGAPALKQMIGVHLDNGIPHHDTFRRVLGRLEPKNVERSLTTLRQRLSQDTPCQDTPCQDTPCQDTPTDPPMDGTGRQHSGATDPPALGESESVPPLATGKHIAIDGKELRGSHHGANGNDPVALLSVYASELNLVIGQSTVDCKTNEIPVAREILATVAIEGATVTADALHCQVETADAIRARTADYLLAVKDNQKGLHNAIKTLFTINKVEKRVPMTTFFEPDKGHGRIETRKGYLIQVSDWLPANDPLRVWKDWQGVLCIESERKWTHRGQPKDSTFVRYFITSSKADVGTLMGFARSHWAIENKLHWVMDVTFGEDASRVRVGNEARNLATLRRVAAFLLKASEPDNLPKAIAGMSLRKRKKWAGWRTDYLQKVLTN